MQYNLPIKFKIVDLEKEIKKAKELQKTNIRDITHVEIMPEFPGGINELSRFLFENIKYPADAREEGTNGTVYVTFVIDSIGAISDIKILRGIGHGCDEEVIRVVKLMPNWIPGKQDGKPVPVQYNLPIKFNLR